MDMPVFSFQETNNLLPSGFHVIYWKFQPTSTAVRVDFPSYPFIKAYLFIREARVRLFHAKNNHCKWGCHGTLLTDEHVLVKGSCIFDKEKLLVVKVGHIK